MELHGKTVWITGASSGIGEALAKAFATRGARLLLSARREDRLREVARACGGGAQVLPLDVSALDELPSKVEQALSMMGSIDVMVHNAGVGQRSLITETSFEVDRKLIDTNYLGPVAITKALLPSMLSRGSGTFVVVSSVLGVISAKRRSGYAGAKHALHGFFDGLRAELEDEGIRVLLVCPGRVHSEFSLRAFEGDGREHGVSDYEQGKSVSPAYCAEQTLRALDRGDAEIYPAKWEHLAVYLQRYAPSLMRTAIRKAKMR